MRQTIARLATLALALTLASAVPATAAGTDPAQTASLANKSAKQLFGHVKAPTEGMAPRAYGFYSKGCLAGAVELPVDGPAWQAMRLSRNRNWGHPELVALVERLARDAKEKDGWPGLLVGDLAQPRGGPMLSGHASHQIGLDADIWLTPMPNRKLSRAEREKMSATSMILDRHQVNPKTWSDAQAKLIKRAASYPEVARIFVHPPIKKALCDWSRGQSDRSWLAKVRAYYGHTYHMHIRIKCPKNSSGCRDQAAPHPKDGTGCGTELAYWMGDKPWAKPKPPKKVAVPLPRPKPKPSKPRVGITLASLPKACTTVIEAK